METKHTIEHANKLAKEFYQPTTTDLICSPQLVRDGYVSGYMKALKETNVKELLEALIEVKVILMKMEYKGNHFNATHERMINNVIKKATE